LTYLIRAHERNSETGSLWQYRAKTTRLSPGGATLFQKVNERTVSRHIQDKSLPKVCKLVEFGSGVI